MTYEELTDCPSELADLHCSHPYATEASMPDTCANNLFGTPPSPTPPTTTSKFICVVMSLFLMYVMMIVCHAMIDLI